VVGAHFITDVIAGGLIYVIIFKIINLYLKKKYKKMFIKNIEFKNISTQTKIMVVFFILSLFISVGYTLDIYVSSLFYHDNSQFLLQNYDLASVVFRKILLPTLIIYVFVLPVVGKIIPIEFLFFNYKFSLKEIFFIWLSGIFTLGLVVNFFLKNLWGRSRPNDIFQFGGSDMFTPWYIVGENCISNCSFVSGDASVGFFLILFYFITKKIIYCYLALFFGTIIGFIRIIAGGHFLSDVIFSQIFVSASIVLCFLVFKRFYDK
jgi:lipid A 4'-phosphatase